MDCVSCGSAKDADEVKARTSKIEIDRQFRGKSSLWPPPDFVDMAGSLGKQ